MSWVSEKKQSRRSPGCRRPSSPKPRRRRTSSTSWTRCAGRSMRRSRRLLGAKRPRRSRRRSRSGGRRRRRGRPAKSASLLLSVPSGYTGAPAGAAQRPVNRKRGGMAWNNHAQKNPRKRQPPSSKAELREMADKAVAGWSKPISRTPVENKSCPSCGYTDTITAHRARCPRCDALK
jgi:hypothetical protein